MLGSILAILTAIVYALKKMADKKEAKNAQAEADAVSSDPTKWFSNHFRVRTKDGASKTDTTEASSGKHKPD